MTAPNAAVERKKIDRVRRALASGAALAAALGPDDGDLRAQAEAMDVADPRLDWLLSQAPRWRDAKEKTLVFVAHRETLEMLRTALSHRAQLASGVFHEELSSARRDTEVARFREHDGPSLLVSTECGGEGRNFEFCRRLVLFDLPWKPSVVEQRIGRLDRIGRRIPVEVVYFRPPGGIGRDVVRLFEALEIFRDPLAGLEPQLAHVEGALEEIALDPQASLSDDTVRRARRRSARSAHTHPRSGIPAAPSRSLPSRRWRPVSSRACRRSSTRSIRRWWSRPASAWGSPSPIRAGTASSRSSSAAEPSSMACRACLAGRPTSVRSIARKRSRTNPSTSSPPGIRSWRESLLTTKRVPSVGSCGSRCRSVWNAAKGSWPIYKDGPAFEIVALDSTGSVRPDWAAAIRQRPLLARAVRDDAVEGSDWRAMVRRLGTQLEPARRPHALAAVVVRPVA